MQDLKYPIGQFQAPSTINKLDISIAIKEIEKLPSQLSNLVKDWDDEKLDTPYRPGGWTVRQLVHHIAESHMNSYVRFKWALTEKTPTIKAYDEKAWCNLADNKKAPISISLDLMKALHSKWVFLMRQIEENDWEKSFVHPESGDLVKLSKNALLYAWHGKHHYAHIDQLRIRNNW